MNQSKQSISSAVREGDFCEVVGGTHAGKSGIARDVKISKTGQATLTIVQSNGERFKTLAKNVVIKKSQKASSPDGLWLIACKCYAIAS